MTFNDVNAHVDGVDISELEQGGKLALAPEDFLTAEPAPALGKVCGVYQKVRPILSMVVVLWFIPAKWRDIVRVFMQNMDLFCPPQQ